MICEERINGATTTTTRWSDIYMEKNWICALKWTTVEKMNKFDELTQRFAWCVRDDRLWSDVLHIECIESTIDIAASRYK